MAQTVKAKFKVLSITDFGNDHKQVKMQAVTSGSEENKSFSTYTPNATLEMYVTNPEAVFEHGEYFIDITKAE